MEFDSFEQALQVCVTAEEGSPEQSAALHYCLENAPPDLRDMLIKRLRLAPGHECGCGGDQEKK